jgi:N-acetylmuramoyl-L-alanine amidase
MGKLTHRASMVVLAVGVGAVLGLAGGAAPASRNIGPGDGSSSRGAGAASSPWYTSTVAMRDVPGGLDRSALPLSVQTVVLDPGHGGRKNPGAVSADGVMEKDLALDIALILQRYLEKAGYRVVLTRSDDRSVPLRSRPQLAGESGGDIFVSIHLNALGKSSRGFETYFLGPSSGEQTTELALFENRGSGRSMTSMRRIFEEIYTAVRQEESRRLAETVHGSLRAHLAAVAPEASDRGVKTAPFLVLVDTEMPAILVEVAALSSDDDTRLLKVQAFREYIALALFSGLDAYARSVGPRPSVGLANRAEGAVDGVRSTAHGKDIGGGTR